MQAARTDIDVSRASDEKWSGQNGALAPFQPGRFNAEDNEKSFANVSEVTGYSRIKMEGVCKTR